MLSFIDSLNIYITSPPFINHKRGLQASGKVLVMSGYADYAKDLSKPFLKSSPKLSCEIYAVTCSFEILHNFEMKKIVAYDYYINALKGLMGPCHPRIQTVVVFFVVSVLGSLVVSRRYEVVLARY